MTFSEAVNTCLKEKYATFEGRGPRSEYWNFVLFYIVAYVALMIVAAILGAISNVLALIVSIVVLVFALGMIIPSISAGVRRLHDIDRSGWWLLIGFVPLVGFIVLLVFFCSKGTDGDNQFGPDPLGAAGVGAARSAV
jgi:uncharacterized membrane protein YhaH (DUF805 family)